MWFFIINKNLTNVYGLLNKNKHVMMLINRVGMMCVKTKILKKLISAVCAVTMAVSFAITSVSAIDTTEGEIAFSMVYMNALPKRKDNGFDIFTSLDYLNLKDAKVYEDVECSNGKKEKITIKEKEVFQQIKMLVHKLVEEVEEKTPGNSKYKGTSDDYANRSIEMRKAEKIYRWVAENIPYEDSGTPQDPLFVFDRRTGVCVGKANLVNLMMRIAKIPCAVIGAPGHAYNAVYLEDVEETRKGWTLLDATWGAPKSDMEKQVGEKIDEKEDNMKMFFPAFYQKSIDFETANMGMFGWPAHKISSIVSCGSHNYVLKDESYWFNLQSNKAIYECFRGAGDAYVKLSGNKQDPAEEVELRPDVMHCGMKILLKSGVKSLVLRGDTSLDLVDLSGANDLRSVNTENSNKYISDAVALYERDNRKQDGKGKIVHLFQGGTTIGEDGLTYRAIIENDKVTKIEVNASEQTDVTVKIPESLREIHVPIKIGFGIQSLILEGDDIVDLSEACSLTTIDVTHSNKYMFEDNVLYERKADGQKGNRVPMYEPEECY